MTRLALIKARAKARLRPPHKPRVVTPLQKKLNTIAQRVRLRRLSEDHEFRTRRNTVNMTWRATHLEKAREHARKASQKYRAQKRTP